MPYSALASGADGGISSCPQGVVACSTCELRTSATSASLTASNRRYQVPTDQKGSGSSRQITSSDLGDFDSEPSPSIKSVLKHVSIHSDSFVDNTMFDNTMFDLQQPEHQGQMSNVASDDPMLRGLTNAQAIARLQRDGPNVLPTRRGTGTFKQFAVADVLGQA